MKIEKKPIGGKANIRDDDTINRGITGQCLRKPDMNYDPHTGRPTTKEDMNLYPGMDAPCTDE